MAASQGKEVFLPRRGTNVSSEKSSTIVRSTVASTWRWLWPDVLMRIIPMGLVPFLYIFVFHLPLAFLGLTWGNVPLQLLLGLGIGIGMAMFAATYRILFVGPWFRWPTLNDHFVQGFYYLFINGPVEELFFRGFMLAAVTQWTGGLVGAGSLVQRPTRSIIGLASGVGAVWAVLDWQDWSSAFSI